MSCVTQLPACTDVRCRQVIPGGATDCSNLVYTTPDKFEAGSLEVYVDGRRLTNILDFTEAVDLMGFTIILDLDDKNRLNTALGQSEDLRVDYTKDSTSCITVL